MFYRHFCSNPLTFWCSCFHCFRVSQCCLWSYMWSAGAPWPGPRAWSRTPLERAILSFRNYTFTSECVQVFSKRYAYQFLHCDTKNRLSETFPLGNHRRAAGPPDRTRGNRRRSRRRTRRSGPPCCAASTGHRNRAGICSHRSCPESPSSAPRPPADQQSGFVAPQIGMVRG